MMSYLDGFDGCSMKQLPNLLTVLLLAGLSTTAAQLFVPSTCRSVCVNGFQDVSTALDAFLNIDPNANSTSGAKRPAFQATRASQWGVTMLQAVKESLARPGGAPQNVTMTPPAVARLLGVYSMSVYQSFAVWSENVYPYGRYFAPLTSDMVNLADPSRAAIFDTLTIPAGDPFRGNRAPDEDSVTVAQEAAISGAAYKMIDMFFCGGATPAWCGRVTPNLTRTMNAAARDMTVYDGVPFKQGMDIATEFYKQFSLADLFNDNEAALRPEMKKNTSQPTAGVHNCSNLQSGYWSWQRLTVPRAPVFLPDRTSPIFPPSSYQSLVSSNSSLVTTPFFRGYAAQKCGPALKSTSENRAMLLEGLNGPPGGPGRENTTKFNAAMREVLKESASLGDAKKVIAEFWADGPDSTTPPGHWFRIAFEESNINANFAIKNLNALDRAVWATFMVGLALHEAAVMAWELKCQTLGARPITGIQCGIGRTPSNTPKAGTAWRGPYLGTGNRDLSTWQPFQPLNFITPPFSGYVSGHATFSAAAAQALRQTRSSFNTSFTMPGYNCFKTPRGSSKVEPMIQPNGTGYVKGITDRPNRGPRTVGYSPARDVVLCWQTYEEAAQQAAVSRMYGGIHIRIDNDDGLLLGRRLGDSVSGAVARLSPDNFLVKANVTSRPTPLGYRNDNDTVTEFVCPPRTFIRFFDGFADETGLFALALSCSDGTLVGNLGMWDVGGTPFAETTITNGYAGIQAVVEAGVVVGMAFFATQADPPDGSTAWYGKTGSAAIQSMCDEGQRIVGFSVVSDNKTPGNIGSVGLLCGLEELDTTYRPSDAVPPGRAGLWYYDYQCPDNTYITRFFGRAGDWLDALTAQCGGYWNLKDIGVPSSAADSTAYTHTSVDGYSGIMVKSFTGGVDCISFVTAAGQVSPVFGNPAVPGPVTNLTCTDGDNIVGLFGWQEGAVQSIGIICGSGPYAIAPTSTRVINRMRNPPHPPRFPGQNAAQAMAAARTTGAQPASKMLPKTRIPTRISGTPRRHHVATVARRHERTGSPVQQGALAANTGAAATLPAALLPLGSRGQEGQIAVTYTTTAVNEDASREGA